MNEHWQRKRDILQQLSAEDFVSGEQLAGYLGVSRTSIANHIKGLADYGVEIFSVKGRGYKLAQTISLIDEKQLTESLNYRCFYFDEIGSTNAFILNNIDELTSGDCCVAEYQSAGRGRRGRTWVSPYGCHLYTSLYWQLSQGISQAGGLSLVVACALVKALGEQGVSSLGVKWPNDIYLNQKKLAGVLIEMSGQAQSHSHIVIGIGINLAMSEQQGGLIDQPWSDLSEQGLQIDKTQLMLALHRQLMRDLQQFEHDGLSAFMERWKESDIFYGQQVSLIMGENQIKGRCCGIDHSGGIILETDGVKQTYIGGEISLRS